MDENTVHIVEATLADAQIIHQMQLVSFKDLLDRYQDFELSPGAEPIERFIARMTQANSTYFLIYFGTVLAGAIRIQKNIKEEICRISPVFILPEYRNKGISQKVFEIIESKYKPRNGWQLDTILEEAGNCYLYEKLGYKKTGKIDFIKDGMHIVRYQKNA
ncbi:GNAT family N-acetyltransferase [Iodobacter sp. HSC-16F04]|uniref:GNAT family N-acetyltransferase n=1 Tax=Iodobacter violaceini TaxID=3044271 RepID=A0ABX0KZC4_9NEIS|nr:GNAT family N-acetyltransferase [Iodobacter violacea]NHQ87359.1 GNAT family N-acetyltransferase [Iodobacter violacea]